MRLFSLSSRVLSGPCLALLLVLGGLPTALGTVTNGDFSSGLSGWSTDGTVSAASSYTYANPGGGTISPQAGSQVTELISLSGATESSVATFLGTTVSAMDALTAETVGKGSALKQTFVHAAGSVIKFEWNMWTRDDRYNDFAFVSLSGPGISGTQLTLLTTANALAGTGPANGSGWQNGVLSLPGTGTYTVGFAVMNVDKNRGESYLHIDNVRTAVPEPSTATAAFLAIFLVCWLPHRRSVARRRHRAALVFDSQN